MLTDTERVLLSDLIPDLEGEADRMVDERSTPNTSAGVGEYAWEC